MGRVAPADRGAALGRLADALSARKGELADLTTAEIGSPRSWSTFGQVITAVGVLRAYASITPHYPFSTTRPSVTGGTVEVRQLPVGVVGAIVPWNTPLFIAALKLGPALAAGCTVVPAGARCPARIRRADGGDRGSWTARRSRQRRQRGR